MAPEPGVVDAQNEWSVATGESCGDVEGPVPQRFGFGTGEITGRQTSWVHDSRHEARSVTWVPAWLRTYSSNGGLSNPVAFQQRTRSSTGAWPLWRSSSVTLTTVSLTAGQAPPAKPNLSVPEQITNPPSSMTSLKFDRKLLHFADRSADDISVKTVRNVRDLVWDRSGSCPSPDPDGTYHR